MTYGRKLFIKIQEKEVGMRVDLSYHDTYPMKVVDFFSF